LNLKSEQRNFYTVRFRIRETTALNIHKSDRKHRPIAVMCVSRLSCELLHYSQRSWLHRFTNKNCLELKHIHIHMELRWCCLHELIHRSSSIISF